MSMDHLEALALEGGRLIDAVARADLDRTVPGLEWDVRTVAIHTGTVHRWAADIVRRRLPHNETGGSQAFWPEALDDRELPGWLTDGLDRLIEELAAAPADLACFTFVPGIPARQFWRRRQAHEMAIHRADVESAETGSVTSFPVDFAQDGLAELVGDFAREAGFASAGSGSLLLQAVDGESWRVDFGGERNVVAYGSSGELGACDATVTGSSSNLYLWAWNRPSARVNATGDPRVIDLWRRVRVT